MLALSALSLLPDADAIGFLLPVDQGGAMGHRGFTHSLVFALAIGLACGTVLRKRGFLRTSALAGAVVASHGLLDTLTNGTTGTMLLWPFSGERFFAPWRPVPVPPVGLGLASARGLEVMAIEAVYFLPLLAWALWPRKRAA
jgi:inner membrane protein